MIATPQFVVQAVQQVQHVRERLGDAAGPAEVVVEHAPVRVAVRDEVCGLLRAGVDDVLPARVSPGPAGRA
jgi:hypothetical protein